MKTPGVGKKLGSISTHSLYSAVQFVLFLFFFFALHNCPEKFKAKSSAASFTFHQLLLKTPPKHRLSDLSSIFHAGICISKKHIRDVCAYRSKCDCTQPAGTLAVSYGEFLHKVQSTFRTDSDGGGGGGVRPGWRCDYQPVGN